MKLQSIRGMNDLLPDQSPTWQYLESVIGDVLARYSYREIRFPILEQTELFKRSIGEVTDIVEKEMYTFEDRNGDSLSLRPEGTASCVRACNQNGLLHNQIQRLWYTGPMFRHERPQKGRLRVATKYINVARQFYAEQGRQADLIKLYGAMELAPILDLAHEIVDIVDTGNTLKANGLEAQEEIADISSRLIVNKAAMKTKYSEIQNIVDALRDAVAAKAVAKEAVEKT